MGLTVNPDVAGGGGDGGGGGGTGGGVAISAGTNIQTSGTVSFANSNNLSWGMDTNGVLTGSVAAPGVSFSAGTASGTRNSLVFSNSNNFSFGMNGSTITGSFAPTVNFSAGTTSGNLGSVVFSNSNGVSAGLNGSTVTFSAAAGSAMSGFAVSNTTQSTSTPIPYGAFSVGGAGMVSVAMSNGSMIVSGPDTTSFAPFAVALTNSGNTLGTSGSATGSAYFFGNGGISISGSTNASNISLSFVDNAATLFHWDWPSIQAVNMTSVQQTNSAYSVQYWPVLAAVSGTRLDVPLFVSAPNVANVSTAAIAFSAQMAIYTRNGSTLSPLIGASNSATLTWASNSSGYSQVTGLKYLSFACATVLTPGEYWIGLNMSTTSGLSVGTATTALNASFSMLCGGTSVGGFNGFADFGAVSNNNSGPLLRGLIASVPTSTSQTLQSSQIAQGVGNDVKANFVAIFRNY